VPRGNRTGPAGAGPMTGRRAGYCTGYDMPGFSNPSFPWRGVGFGFRGGGFGWRNMFYATGLPGWLRYIHAQQPPQDESETLRVEANWLKSQLDAINKRIDDLEKK